MTGELTPLIVVCTLVVLAATATAGSAASSTPTLQEAEKLAKALGRNPTPEQRRSVAEYFTKLLARPDLDEKDRGRALAERGTLFLQMGMAQAAKKDFDSVVTIFPKEWLSWSTRAFADEALGDLDLAISDLSKSIELAPDSNMLFERRGDDYYKKGDYERAIDDYRQVVRLHREYGKQIFGRDLGTRTPGLVYIYEKLAQSYSALAKASQR